MFVSDAGEGVLPRGPISTAETPTRKFRGRVFIDLNHCKGCGFGVEFCPPKVLALTSSYNDLGCLPPQFIRKGGVYRL